MNIKTYEQNFYGDTLCLGDIVNTDAHQDWAMWAVGLLPIYSYSYMDDITILLNFIFTGLHVYQIKQRLGNSTRHIDPCHSL